MNSFSKKRVLQKQMALGRTPALVKKNLFGTLISRSVPRTNFTNSPQQAILAFPSASLLTVCPNTTRALFHGRKQILSAQLSAFYLCYCGSRLLLFLHVPDIIIAVRRMIICLLWKLADCLSPVPEELPLKGVPLEKHHKVASAVLRRTREQIERLKTERKIRQMQKEGEREKVNVYLNCTHVLLRFVSWACCLVKSGQQAADDGWNGGFGSHKMNAFKRGQCIYIYTDISLCCEWDNNEPNL